MLRTFFGEITSGTLHRLPFFGYVFLLGMLMVMTGIGVGLASVWLSI